jgi:hypothetical protein
VQWRRRRPGRPAAAHQRACLLQGTLGAGVGLDIAIQVGPGQQQQEGRSGWLRVRIQRWRRAARVQRDQQVGRRLDRAVFASHCWAMVTR